MDDGSEAGASRGQVGIWGEKTLARHRRLSLVSRDFQAGFAFPEGWMAGQGSWLVPAAGSPVQTLDRDGTGGWAWAVSNRSCTDVVLIFMLGTVLHTLLYLMEETRLVDEPIQVLSVVSHGYRLSTCEAFCALHHQTRSLDSASVASGRPEWAIGH